MKKTIIYLLISILLLQLVSATYINNLAQSKFNFSDYDGITSITIVNGLLPRGNYDDCGRYLPLSYTKGKILLSFDEKCNLEKDLQHELKHHYCWLKERYLGHEGCFLR